MPDGCGSGGGGEGRRVGGAFVRPRGKVAMSRDRVLVPATSFAVEASSLSTIYCVSITAGTALRLFAYLIAELEA